MRAGVQEGSPGAGRGQRIQCRSGANPWRMNVAFSGKDCLIWRCRNSVLACIRFSSGMWQAVHSDTPGCARTCPGIRNEEVGLSSCPSHARLSLRDGSTLEGPFDVPLSSCARHVSPRPMVMFTLPGPSVLTANVCRRGHRSADHAP